MKRLLAFVAAAAAAAVFTAAAVAASPYRCTPTPQDAFGPFGRGMPPLRASIGRGHVLTGVVLSALNCRPIPRARVELWQEDATGRYTRASSATVIADRAGRFRFEGPFPYSDGDFPPHIHLRVLAPAYKPLLTRYEPAQGERSGKVQLVLEPEAL